MKATLRTVAWLVGAGIVWVLAPATSRSVAVADEAAPAATYIGTESCLGCHEDQAKGMGPHGSANFTARGIHGCETCHGPGSLHEEDPEGWQPRVTDLSVAARNEMCTSCHSGGEQMMWVGSAHDRRNVSCTDCHSVHQPQGAGQLAKATELETCGSCHADVRAELWRNSHHPVREGEISCSDCHNPHGTPFDKQIREASVNEQCYSCHTEKRGPFLWEHAPVRENCLSCHNAHGSNHLKLQKTSVPFLCQQCHANTRHPGTLYDGSTLADQALASNRIFNRACLDCHASIHGTNHPSSPYLGH
jgi:DmsE family decaheme c-type cytochrome